MPKNPQYKWIGLLILLVGAVFLLYPSVNWYSLDPAERAKLEALRERPKYLVNLGLDLKGGTHMVMELEVDKLDAKTPLHDAMSQAIEIIRNRVDQFGVAEPLIVQQGARWIVVQLPGVTDSAHAKELVGKTVCVVANLPPRDFGKGLVSHGMILASGPSEALHLATVDDGVSPGSKLK